MLSANEIREIKFSNSAVGGYKKDEVEAFLDQIVEDYREYDRTLKAAAEKIDSLNAELNKAKASEDSIQNVLLSAQRLADSIVEEAKTKSAQIVRDAERSITDITEKERELSAAFERKATARREEIEREFAAKELEGQKKLEAIEKATADSIERQQRLFNKLKIEISAFKAEVNKRYKEHLESLQRLPDEVPADPTEIAAAVAEAFDKAPAAESFLEKRYDFPIDEPTFDESDEDMKIVEDIAPAVEEEKADVNEAPAAKEDFMDVFSKEAATPAKPTGGFGGGFIITSDD